MDQKDFTSVGVGWTGELPNICTLEEVAQFLRETVSSVRLMVRRDEFPNAWRSSKGYRIPKTDVLAYIEGKFGQKDIKKREQRNDAATGPDPDDPDSGIA